MKCGISQEFLVLTTFAPWQPRTLQTPLLAVPAHEIWSHQAALLICRRNSLFPGLRAKD